MSMWRYATARSSRRQVSIHFTRLSELEGRLSGILGCKVDVIEEPVRKKRFQTEIGRDRALAF